MLWGWGLRAVKGLKWFRLGPRKPGSRTGSKQGCPPRHVQAVKRERGGDQIARGIDFSVPGSPRRSLFETNSGFGSPKSIPNPTSEPSPEHPRTLANANLSLGSAAVGAALSSVPLLRSGLVLFRGSGIFVVQSGQIALRNS